MKNSEVLIKSYRSKVTTADNKPAAIARRIKLNKAKGKLEAREGDNLKATSNGMLPEYRTAPIIKSIGTSWNLNFKVIKTNSKINAAKKKVKILSKPVTPTSFNQKVNTEINKE
jgi:hypothetical protein